MSMYEGDLNNKEIRDVQEDMAAAECIMVNQAMEEHKYQIRESMEEETIIAENELF